MKKTVNVLNAWEINRSGKYVEICESDVSGSVEISFINSHWIICDLPNMKVTEDFDRSKANRNRYIRIDNI